MKHGPRYRAVMLIVVFALVSTAIAADAGLDDKATAHIGRHTFVNELIRGGEDLVIVAEIAGHARLETLRV